MNNDEYHLLFCLHIIQSMLLYSLKLCLILWLFFCFKDQKFPGPPAYIFMIDVSYQSVQCGMVRMLMKELGELLDHLPK